MEIDFENSRKDAKNFIFIFFTLSDFAPLRAKLYKKPPQSTPLFIFFINNFLKFKKNSFKKPLIYIEYVPQKGGENGKERND